MPALQVKDFPPQLYESLRRCAAEEDRSIAQQTVHILRVYLADRAVRDRLGEEGPTPSRREQALERLRAWGPLEVHGEVPDVVSVVRQSRDERESQLGEVLAQWQ